MRVWLKRATAGLVLGAVGRARRNRQRFYDGRSGLRILTFHAMDDGEFDDFRRFMDWCRERFVFCGPEAVDELPEASAVDYPRDRLLVTVDDGHREDHRTAAWLADRGIRGVFFVVPSYVGRSVGEYLAFHEANGVAAFDIGGGRGERRGLTESEIREIDAMGHRVAAHNFAHRDLGRLTSTNDLDYEIGRALDRVSKLIGRPCLDFAWGWGGTAHLSPAAARYLLDRGLRTFSSVRGLNLPGAPTGFLLRDAIYPNMPHAFNRLCVTGGADDRYEDSRTGLRRLAGSESEGE